MKYFETQSTVTNVLLNRLIPRRGESGFNLHVFGRADTQIHWIR